MAECNAQKAQCNAQKAQCNAQKAQWKHIDTLILSGGGPSGIAYFGIFESLFENNILNRDLSGINEILTTSIGILCSFCLIIGLNMNIGKEIALGYDISKMLDIENITIDNILVEFGLFDTYGIRNIFKSILKNYKQLDDINLKDLYDLTNIKLTVKVFNTTKKQIEYISYQTDPELSIITLAEMTTAIPVFFKPVEYKGFKYVDGGLRGHFPIEECKSENYLGLFIKGGASVSGNSLIDMFPIVEFLYSLMINQDQVVYDIQENNRNPKIIYVEVNHGLNFNMTKKESEKIIKLGYDSTEQHLKIFKKHLVKDKV